MSGSGISAQWLAQHISGNTSREIRSGVAHLIESGEVPPGTRLPTIRDLARELDAKVSAVTDAWSHLRRESLLETSRRGGTRVTSATSVVAAPAVEPFHGWNGVELIHALPDVLLVPDTAAIFADSVNPGRAVSQLHLDPLLNNALRTVWPVPAGSFAVLPSGKSAVLMTLRAIFARGAKVVAAESPGLIRTRGAVEQFGTSPVPIEVDEHGPVPESLKDALHEGADVIIFQPSGQIPLGARLTEDRRDTLADIISDGGFAPWIVEDDASSGLFEAASLGPVFPEKTVRIGQFWRAFGADVAITVVGGASSVIDHVREQQRDVGIQVSGLLQSVLAKLLTDEKTRLQAEFAASVYQQRHEELAIALGRHGLTVESFGGLFAWIPVASESSTIAHLSALGIRVQSGQVAQLTESSQGHLRIATTRLPDDPALIDDLAATIALASSGQTLVDVE